MYVPAGRGGSSVTAGPRQAGAVADTVTIGLVVGAALAGHCLHPPDIGFARLISSPTGFHVGSAAAAGGDGGTGIGAVFTSTAGVSAGAAAG
jgi:hypothetical protein